MRITKRVMCILFVGASVLGVICAGCSNDADKHGETEKFTTEAGQKAVKNIRQPLDKARQVEDLVNAHNENLEKTVKRMKK